MAQWHIVDSVSAVILSMVHEFSCTLCRCHVHVHVCSARAKVLTPNPKRANPCLVDVWCVQVCSASAKVQLNTGILMRRHHHFPAALDHFRQAQAVDPTYCEPSYWVGVTAINSGGWWTLPTVSLVCNGGEGAPEWCVCVCVWCDCVHNSVLHIVPPPPQVTLVWD